MLAILACFRGEPCVFAQATFSHAAKERLKERDRYKKEAQTLQAQGKLAEAITAAQKVLSIEREVLGNVHEDAVGTLLELAEMYTDQEDFARARQAAEEGLATSSKLPVERQWQLVNARLALEYVDHVAALELDQRRRLARARQLLQTVKELDQQGKFGEALGLAREAGEIHKQILGEKHQHYGGSLNSLGVMFWRMGQYAQAEALLQRSLEIREAKLGKDHPDVAKSLSNLAVQYQALRQPTKALPLYERSLEIREAKLGKDHADVAISLYNLANLYQGQGQLGKAEPLYQRSLRILEAKLGKDHPDVVATLENLANVYTNLGEYAKAEPLFDRCLKIREARLGKDDPLVAQTLNNAGTLYQSMGRLDQAELLYQRSLQIRETKLGKGHVDVAQSLNNLASLYKAMRQYAKAEPLAVRSLQIREARLGNDHPDVAASLTVLAGLYLDLGQYAKAEPFYQRSLEIRQAKLGQDHPLVADTLNNLAVSYQALRQYAKAERLYQRSLEIRETKLGKDHPEVGQSLKNLASLYGKMGEYAKAEPLYVRSLKIREARLGKDHPDVATSLNELAVLYKDLGQLTKAESLCQRSLHIRESRLGKDHPDVANSLNDLADIYSLTGRYAMAEPLYHRSLQIREAKFGKDHRYVADILNNLAILYKDMGQYAKAEPLYQRSLEIWELQLGKDHPDVARSLNNLALFYVHLGQYSKAESFYQRSLQIQEAQLGKDHPDVAASLNNLAGLYYHLDQLSKAEPLYQRSLEIREAKLGKDHPEVAGSLNNLALLYREQDQLAKAERVYQRALEIYEVNFGKDHARVAIVLSNLANLYVDLRQYAKAEALYERSLQITEAQLGKDHPDKARRLINLAWLYHATNRTDKALELHEQCMKIDQANLRDVFGFSAEPDMHAYLATSKENLELLVNATAAAQTPDRAAKTALTWTLRRKAIILDTICRYRQAQRLLSEDESLGERVVQLRGLRQRLANLALKTAAASDAGNVRQEMTDLRDRADRLEAQLNRALSQHDPEESGNSLPIDANRVQSRLAPGAALVEVLRVWMADFNGVGKRERKPAHYFAFVLSAGNDPIRQIDLGPAEAIDRAVGNLREQMERAPRELRLTDEKSLEADFRRVAGEVYRSVFAPLRPALGLAKLVYLAADGELNRLPFEALTDPDGKYLIESYRFSYLSSGRDLLRAPVKPARGTAVFAGPDFNLKAARRQEQVAALPKEKDVVALRGRTTSDLRGLLWKPLPGAAAEAADIEKALQDSAYGPVKTYAGDKALEDVLKRLPPPRVLHLATHGFFLEDPKRIPPDERDRLILLNEGGGQARLRLMENPLLRSGIVLAGANALGEQGTPAGIDDGWVTAEEIALMDLRGTELVVLSACETGLGDIKTGEGVYGLRRAFMYAGARTLVTSLFKVPDEQTRQMMRSFYGGLKAGKGKLASLHDAQLEMIRQRRQEHGAAHPFFWASFVLVGDPD